MGWRETPDHSLETNHDTLKRKREKVHDKVRKLKKQIESLSEQIVSDRSKYESDVADERNKYEILRQDNLSLKDQISKASSNEESYSCELEELKKKVGDLDRTNQDLMFNNKIAAVKKEFDVREIVALKESLKQEKERTSKTENAITEIKLQLSRDKTNSNCVIM